MIALATTAIAWVIFVVSLIGWVIYYFANRSAAQAELGSEIELAPNRQPYYDDETLEGSRLERVQLLGVLLLVTMVIGLPLYWVLEPGRQAGAVSDKEDAFVGWGAELFETTANGGFNCAGCHGGMKATGGQAPTAVTDPKTGEVKAVNWYAPALNTVFYRFTERRGAVHPQLRPPVLADVGVGHRRRWPDERTRQIETLIAYLRSIQLQPEGCLTEPAFEPVSG